MNWYIRKGEAVAAEREIIVDGRTDFDHLPQLNVPLDFDMELLASSLEEAPLMCHKASTLRVCTVSADAAAVPRHLFIQQTNSTGQKRWNLIIALVMKIDSANIEFEIRVAGETYGVAHASFDH